MIIYGAFIIPILCSIFLLYFYKKRVVWWEFVIIFTVCIPVIFTAKYLSEKAQVTDVEYWGSLAKIAIHDEPWNEYIHQTCTRPVSCGKDCTTIQTYDCSYVQYHPRYCRFNTSINETVNLSYDEYKKVVKKWGGKEIFTDMHRNYHTIDGNRFHVSWDNNYDTAIPIVVEHSWENRVQAASDVFNFPEVSEEDKTKYALYDYPKEIGYSLPTIMGIKDPEAQKRFMYLNALYGPMKRIRLWVLIYYDKTLDAGEYQEMLWKKGNKNEPPELLDRQ